MQHIHSKRDQGTAQKMLTQFIHRSTRPQRRKKTSAFWLLIAMFFCCSAMAAGEPERLFNHGIDTASGDVFGYTEFDGSLYFGISPDSSDFSPRGLNRLDNDTGLVEVIPGTQGMFAIPVAVFDGFLIFINRYDESGTGLHRVSAGTNFVTRIETPFDALLDVVVWDEMLWFLATVSGSESECERSEYYLVKLDSATGTPEIVPDALRQTCSSGAGLALSNDRLILSVYGSSDDDSEVEVISRDGASLRVDRYQTMLAERYQGFRPSGLNGGAFFEGALYYPIVQSYEPTSSTPADIEIPNIGPYPVISPGPAGPLQVELARATSPDDIRYYEVHALSRTEIESQINLDRVTFGSSSPRHISVAQNALWFQSDQRGTNRNHRTIYTIPAGSITPQRVSFPDDDDYTVNIAGVAAGRFWFRTSALEGANNFRLYHIADDGVTPVAVDLDGYDFVDWPLHTYRDGVVVNARDSAGDDVALYIPLEDTPPTQSTDPIPVELMVNPPVAVGDAAWVYFDDDSKQWVTPACREALFDAGLGEVETPWNEIDAYPDTLAWASCDVLIQRFVDNTPPTPGGGDTDLTILINGSDAADGFVIFEDGTSQWVGPLCRSQLADAGVTETVSDWSAISAYPTGSWRSCDDIVALAGSSGGGNGEGEGESPTLLLPTTGGLAGVVLFTDGTRQWVNASCRVELQAASIDERSATWTEINGYPPAAGRTCPEILALIDDGAGSGGSSESLVFMGGNGIATGWILLPENNVKQWINADCAEQIRETDVERLFFDSGVLASYPDTSDWQSCDDILASIASNTGT